MYCPTLYCGHVGIASCGDVGVGSCGDVGVWRVCVDVAVDVVAGDMVAVDVVAGDVVCAFILILRTRLTWM